MLWGQQRDFEAKNSGGRARAEGRMVNNNNNNTRIKLYLYL